MACTPLFAQSSLARRLSHPRTPRRAQRRTEDCEEARRRRDAIGRTRAPTACTCCHPLSTLPPPPILSNACWLSYDSTLLGVALAERPTLSMSSGGAHGPAVISPDAGGGGSENTSSPGDTVARGAAAEPRPRRYDHVRELLAELHGEVMEHGAAVWMDAEEVVQLPSSPCPREVPSAPSSDTDSDREELSETVTGPHPQPRDEGTSGSTSGCGQLPRERTLRVLASRQGLDVGIWYQGKPNILCAGSSVCFALARREEPSTLPVRLGHVFSTAATSFPPPPPGRPFVFGGWRRGTAIPISTYGSTANAYTPTAVRYNLAWPSQARTVDVPDGTQECQTIELSVDLKASFDRSSCSLTLSILALNMSVDGQLEKRVRGGAVLGYFVDRVRIEATADDPAEMVLDSTSPQATAADIPVHQEVERGRERQQGFGLAVGASPSATVTGGHVTNTRTVEGADATRRAWTWRSAKTKAGTAAVWTWAMSAWEGGLGYDKTVALRSGEPLPRLDPRLAGAASVSGTAERVGGVWTVRPRQERPAAKAGGPVQQQWPPAVRLTLRVAVSASMVLERSWARRRLVPLPRRTSLVSWPARPTDPDATASFDLVPRLR